MLTLNPLCQEGIEYVEEQLLLRRFDKRGKLFIRRNGPIMAVFFVWAVLAVLRYSGAAAEEISLNGRLQCGSSAFRSMNKAP